LGTDKPDHFIEKKYFKQNCAIQLRLPQFKQQQTAKERDSCCTQCLVLKLKIKLKFSFQKFLIRKITEIILPWLQKDNLK
jgi:hypothetical protein